MAAESWVAQQQVGVSLFAPKGSTTEAGRCAVHCDGACTASAPTLLNGTDIVPTWARKSHIGHLCRLAQDSVKSLQLVTHYADSPLTLEAYRKEAERLLLWCVFQRQAALSDLVHDDLLLYQQFLFDPQPAQRWVITPGQKPSRRPG